MIIKSWRRAHIELLLGSVRSPDSLLFNLTEGYLLDFPVLPYKGTKSIVISTVSWIGGKNPFLGWAYVAAASVFVLLAVLGTIRHLVKPRYVRYNAIVSDKNAKSTSQAPRGHDSPFVESIEPLYDMMLSDICVIITY
jgi:hypothetical protein